MRNRAASNEKEKNKIISKLRKNFFSGLRKKKQNKNRKK